MSPSLSSLSSSLSTSTAPDCCDSSSGFLSPGQKVLSNFSSTCLRLVSSSNLDARRSLTRRRIGIFSNCREGQETTVVAKDSAASSPTPLKSLLWRRNASRRGQFCSKDSRMTRDTDDRQAWLRLTRVKLAHWLSEFLTVSRNSSVSWLPPRLSRSKWGCCCCTRRSTAALLFSVMPIHWRYTSLSLSDERHVISSQMSAWPMRHSVK